MNKIDTNDYTITGISSHSDACAIFIPGLACNRFGHPIQEKPMYVIEDIERICTNQMPIAYIDTYHLQPGVLTEAPTIYEQAAQVETTVKDILNTFGYSRYLFIAQSLGSIVLFNLLQSQPQYSHNNNRAALLAPPTIYGRQHRKALTNVFMNRSGTIIDNNYNGRLEYGAGDVITVQEQFWQSIDRNEFANVQRNLIDNLGKCSIFIATNDLLYPNSMNYIKNCEFDTCIVEIPGDSHTFKTPEMRSLFSSEFSRIVDSM